MKGIIVAAGYGTRFLPVTKTIPKEMIPLVNVPSIQFIVDEFVASGITDIVIISSRRKKALEDYFDREIELETRLLELFGAHGISKRIDVIRADAAGFYREVDVVLAPFVAANPHDVVAALTAGVPVVALAGPGRHRRQASTLLHHAGLDELVAADVAEYLELAVGLAESAEARAHTSAAIAAGLASSPVFDSSQFAVAFDTALLEIAGQKA